MGLKVNLIPYFKTDFGDKKGIRTFFVYKNKGRVFKIKKFKLDFFSEK